MNRAGKKTREWERIRAKLKPRFEKAGITSCEIKWAGCMGDNFLGFAHLKKRRNLKPDELWNVVLACSSCHQKSELMKEEVMGTFLYYIIQTREKQP